MDYRGRPVSFVGVLAAAAVGLYALIVAGATTAIADAARACPTWPACNGRWLSVSSPALAVVWTHRLTALVVGALVVGAAVLAWRRDVRPRVRAVVTLAALLYPAQVGIGAVAAVSGAPALVSTAHLIVGMALFCGLVVSLAWTLEERVPAGTGNRVPAGTGNRAPAGTGDGASATRDDAPSGERDAPTERASDPEPGAGTSGALATVRAYVRLTKPRLMWLLCLVATAGMALASGPGLDAGTVAATLGGGVLAIGASGTFNNVFERDVDREMERTADRPVAQARIPARNALAFGLLLAVASVIAFLQVNALAAALGVAAILYYSVVYTLVLKPHTVQNTVVGGFAGSLPALIGWAAVTGTVGVPGLVLALVIFLWTPAHFYNLALAYKEDYERGGFPMLPVVRGERVTRKHIVFYLGATLASAVALTAVTGLGPLYAATSVVFGGVFLWAVVRLHRERTKRAALRSFHASNAYLGTLLVAVVLDALLV